ncbi:MAG: M43 family zinc metalloprotease [Saprospiraceae bacterium]|nr:M43 family zinc metalloprotease [Saprospiraceae bacterium]
MKKLLLVFVGSLLCMSIYGQRQCGSMDHLHQEIEQNPERAKVLQDIENHTSNWIKHNADNSERAVVTIPVVFHVVYRTSSENISDAQLQSQLDVLTDDFRRLNSDADGTWSQAADTEIEFCLATVDPNGNATNGITRTSTSVNGFGTNDAVKFNSSGGKDAWPAGDYLNFWVCNIGGGILGYAQFPGGAAATDGVVCDYRYTGTIGTATAPFDLGRTATHEVGHWLNLRHIWGDGGCGVDDFVSDTPTSDGPNYGCTPTHVSCGSTDMVQNYMDYSDDGCMNLYTLGQKNRMQALFGSGGFRASLLSSNGCGDGNPPPPPPGCDDNLVTITLNFDNYPEETSWQITNGGGSVVASGGTYAGQADGSTLVIEECLVDGCYDFTIFDSYGDGICCAYGNGSYDVSDGSTSVASGGSFASSETTNFCVGGGTTPTCDDGIQNQGETGIDCGGPCTACPTCDDGIQNQGETGVDCGGPCAACPTCDDGIQNGNETGVDCGGPDCAPCGGGGNDVILAHFFESGWDGWQDGGSDCYRYSGTRSWEGSYSIRIRDNSGTASAMTSSSYDVSSYNSLEIEFYFYPNSMETGEDFFVRYYDGSSWSTVATYASGTSFTNNSFYVATVTVNSANYNFPSNAQFRFQCDASGNADRVYIDAVTITGIGSGARIAEGPTQTIREVGSGNEAKIGRDLDEDGFNAYPNPASTDLTIESEDVIQSMKVLDITGKVVASRNVNATQTKLDVTTFQPGVYLISIHTEDEVVTKKFIKQ